MTFDRAFGASRPDRDFLRRMILLSLLLHILALSLSSLIPKTSAPKATSLPSYTVNLVSQADIGMKGGPRESASGRIEKEPVEIPTVTGKVSSDRVALPSSKPVQEVKTVKIPDKPAEKVVEKIQKRVAAPLPSKPDVKKEKVKAPDVKKVDAIGEIIKRVDSTPKAALKPVVKKENAKVAHASKVDAIGEIIKRVDSTPKMPSKPVAKGEAGRGSEASLGKAIDEIRKRVDYADQKQRSAGGSAKGAGAGGGVSGMAAGGGPSGTAANTELNARMYAYYRVIWARIKKQWTMSPGLMPRQNIGAIIHVRILRNGAVEGISYEKRSGNTYFDESALRAVRKASPFPPLPEGMGEEGVEMGIRFHAAELR